MACRVQLRSFVSIVSNVRNVWFYSGFYLAYLLPRQTMMIRCIRYRERCVRDASIGLQYYDRSLVIHCRLIYSMIQSQHMACLYFLF